eukprot:gene10408-11495_t
MPKGSRKCLWQGIGCSAGLVVGSSTDLVAGCSAGLVAGSSNDLGVGCSAGLVAGGSTDLGVGCSAEGGMAILLLLVPGKFGICCWSSCTQCKDDLLVGALQYRCSREVNEACRKMVFYGTIDEIPCITLDANFLAMTSTEVLSNVGPMLKRRDGRAYRQRAGQNRNEWVKTFC